MEKSKEKLVESHLDFAYRYIEIRRNSGYERIYTNLGVNVESEVLYALYIAAEKYDEKRGVKFATFAKKCFDHQLYQVARKNEMYIRANYENLREEETDFMPEDEIAFELSFEEALSKACYPKDARLKKCDWLYGILFDETLSMQAGRLGLVYHQVHYDRAKILKALLSDVKFREALEELFERRLMQGEKI